jgi:hypothetical protein
LQPFYEQTIKNIHLQDQRELSEAISHLISAVPTENISQALHLFCLPVARRLHSIMELDVDPDDRETVVELNGKQYLM